MNRTRIITAAALAVLNAALSLACSRENKIYSDPSVSSSLTPVATTPSNLPEDFFNQSVNRASVEIQPETVSSDARAIRFQTETGANPVGAFNGAGTGNSAILGISSWSGLPVTQAEPLTFDAKNYVGSLKISVSLQIDLSCDGADIRVVRASGTDIESQPTIALGDGYVRFAASLDAPIWLSRSQPILDPVSGDTLLSDSGPSSSLQALLAKYPAACLKTAATTAAELPLGIPTAAILWSLGDDTTINANVVFARRLTVGSEIYENLQ